MLKEAISKREYTAIIAVLLVVLSVFFISGSYFVDDTTLEFDNGTHFNTQANSSGVFLSLNNLTGGYTSRVLDPSVNSTWKNISFVNNSATFNSFFAVDGDGEVWRSTNRAITWTQQNASYGGTTGTHGLSVDYNGTLYIINNQDIYKSTDKGVIWSLVNSDFNPSDANDAAYILTNSTGSLFVLDENGDVWVSTNAGMSFTLAGDINPDSSAPGGFAVNYSNALFAVDNNADVWRSTNNAVSWSLVKDDYNAADNNAGSDSMAINSSGVLFIIRNDDLWRSTDNGLNWSLINADFNPSDASDAIAMAFNSSGSLFIVDASGDVWVTNNTGINLTFALAGDINPDSAAPKGLAIFSEKGNLTFSVRNCNIANCSDGSFSSISHNSSFNLVGRYFQYRVNFSRISNESNSVIYNVSIGYDAVNDAPHVFIILPENNSLTNSNQSIKINFSISDVNSNNQSCWYNVNGGNDISITNCVNTTFNVAGEGNYTLRVFANDSLGLVNFSSVNFTVDLTRPMVSLLYPQNNTLYDSSQSALNYSVSDIHLSNCWYSTNSSVNVSVSCGTNITDLVSSEGSNTWKIYANDSAGNENSSSINFSVDTIGPIVSIILPVEGSTFGSNLSIKLNYSVSDPNPASCWYNVNNGTNITLSSCANITFNVSGSGSYIVYLYANDSLGHLSYDFSDFSVNVGAPSITTHYPSNNQYLNYTNNIPFNFTPFDIDLAGCELWGNFNGVFALNQTKTNPTNNSVNNFSLNLSEGSYFWNIRCNDTANHSAFNGNKTFFVDVTHPLIHIAAPTGTYGSLTGIPLSYSITDNSPAHTCIYNVSSLNTGNTVIPNTVIENCSTSLTFNVDDQVDHRLYLIINDSAGNRNVTSNTFSVSISSGSPGDGGSSGGSGGGSSGGINPLLFSNARVNVTNIGSIIANGGDKKTLSVNINNVGKIFLNSCRLRASGDMSEWFYSEGTKGIAPGQSVDFLFNINIPEGIEGGDYDGKLIVSCKELNQSQDILVSIPIGTNFIEVSDIEQDIDQLTVDYIFKSAELEGNEFSVNIWVENENNEKIAEIQDNFVGDADSETERNVVINLPSGISGVHYVYLSLADNPDNYIRRLTVLTPVTGRAIFDNTGGKIFTYVVFALILGSGIFFILKNFIHTKKYNPFKKNYWRSRTLHRKINLVDKG